MARYFTMHTLACLTRQGAEALTGKLQSASAVTAQRILFNMVEGKMLVEFEAGDKAALENWLKIEEMHYDWILRMEFETSDGRLVALS